METVFNNVAGLLLSSLCCDFFVCSQICRFSVVFSLTAASLLFFAVETEKQRKAKFNPATDDAGHPTQD